MGSRIFGALKNSLIFTKARVPDAWKGSRNNCLYFTGVQRSFCGGFGQWRSGQCNRSFLRLVQVSQQQRHFQAGSNGSFLNAQHQQSTLGEHEKTVEEKSKEEAEEDARKHKQLIWSFWIVGIMCAAGTAMLVYVYGAPARDESGNIIEDEYTKYSLLPQYILRFYKEVLTFKKTIEEPTRDALLPAPLKAPYRQPPYTLCLELTGVLVKPEWSYMTGWRFKKRPGVNFLLQQLGMQGLFEIVIYTKENGFTAFPIIDNLDPQGFIMYRLFKDDTRYQDGVHMKDLGALNRPINRVIHVDCDEKEVQLNRSNAICLKKWSGDMDDKTLVDLAIFLRTIAESGVEDVRGVLEYYAQFDDPLQVFRENQRKLQEQQQETMEALKSKAMPAWSAFRQKT